MEKGFLETEDGFRLSYAYYPVDNAKALIVLVHGILEHKERYEDFIMYLNAAGFSCIIHDNRGHGLSVDRKYILGHIENIEEPVNDLYTVMQYAKKKNPALKTILFGHSFGSVIARNFLMNHDDEIDGLVLSGTVAPVPKFVTAFIGLCKLLSPITGGKYGRSRIVSLFNMTGKSAEKWISYNKANIAATLADPLMAMRLDNSFNICLYQMTANLSKPSLYMVANPELKILSVTGEDDPCAGGKMGRRRTYLALKKIGYTFITNRVYCNMMHEILNEDNHMKVYKDIVEFINIVI